MELQKCPVISKLDYSAMANCRAYSEEMLGDLNLLCLQYNR